MEEITAEILTEGGGRARTDDIEEIVDIGRRIGEVYDTATRIHITSKGGTDITADISGMPPGYHSNRRSQIPFSRNPETGKLGGGTWPFGEVHVEPLPETANGVVVWDVTAHHPSGRWENPVALTIKDGRVVDIEGSHEAKAVRWYLETYGDENSWAVGGEMAIGTMRSEKKRYGQMHFGIGHGSDRGIVNSVLRMEGIVDSVTVVADDTVVCENGEILV
jgi:leucyl aminopeptidase (aminopeptidase T)